MAKILISPLGAVNAREGEIKREYRSATYKFADSKKEYKSSFVSAVLAEHLKVDRIITIGTGRSMWEEVYRYYAQNSEEELDEDYWLELGEKLDSSVYGNLILKEEELKPLNQVVDSYLKKIYPQSKGGSRALLIDYGIKEAELWNNFDIFMKLSQSLNSGDQIYLDITHSFRSLPLFMYLMMEAIQNLRSGEIELAGLYYGMLDVHEELSYAPIVNLKPFFEISKWIRGIYDFTNYGNGYLISELVADRDIAKKINNISNLININYLVDLREQINSLNKLLQNRDLDKLKILTSIRPKLESFINRFSDLEKEGEFQREMANWFFENKRYSNGYICLLESILTSLCELKKLDYTDHNHRKRMKSLLYNINNQAGFLDNFNREEKKLLKELSEKFEIVNKIRRQIAHADNFRDTDSFASDIELASKYYTDIKKYFNKENWESILNRFDFEDDKESQASKKSRINSSQIDYIYCRTEINNPLTTLKSAFRENDGIIEIPDWCPGHRHKSNSEKEKLNSLGLNTDDGCGSCKGSVLE